MTADPRDQLVSVIIPTFNAEAYLAETIGSVLDQDWEPLELIVVDDGSTDASLSIAGSFGSRVRIVAGPHQGLAATRNRGMAAARGACFMHLDADDLLAPRSIGNLIQHLDDRHDIVAGRLACFVSPELPRSVADRFVLPPGPQRGHLPGASLIRADAFGKFGRLDEAYGVSADLEWWVRARDQGAAVRLVEDVVVRRRIHGNNLSIRHREQQAKSSIATVRAALQRRRLAATSQ